MRPDRRALPFDETTVTLALDGHRPKMSSADRLEAVRRLHATGLHDRQIATRLNLSPRSILRIRTAVKLAATVNNAGEPVATPRPELPEPRVARADTTRHRGARNPTVDSVERSNGSASFIDGFFADPFNRLVADTHPPCVDQWAIFSPPEKPDDFNYQTADHKRSEKLRVADGRAICARCPIQSECLEYAMRPGDREGAAVEVGIWSSTVPQQRINLHRARAAATR